MDTIDVQNMKSNDLLDLLEHIIARDNYGEADRENADSDTVLYLEVRAELERRM